MIRIAIAEAGKVPQLLTFSKDQLTLGRTADNDVCLPGKGVSSQHCRIAKDGDYVWVEDMGSTNGTYVNQQRIAAATLLGPGDDVVVAMYRVRVLGENESAAALPAPDSVRPSDLGSSLPPPGAQTYAMPPNAQGYGPPVAAQGYGVPDQGYPVPDQGYYSALGAPGTAAAAATAAPSGRPASEPPPGAPMTSAPAGDRPPSQPPAGGPGGESLEASGARPGANPSSNRPPTSEDLEWGREWQRIDRLAFEWLASGKNDTKLLRGDKLEHARRWIAGARGRTPPPKREHRDFIAAGLRARKLRNAGVLTLAGLGLAAASVGAVVLFLRPMETDPGIAPVRADLGSGTVAPEVDNPDTPEAGTRDTSTADAITAKAEAVLEEDPRLAASLAVAALRQLPPADDVHETLHAPAAKVLRAALTKLAGRPFRGEGERVRAVAVSPDGRFIASASGEKRGAAAVRLWDQERRGMAELPVLRGHAAPVTAMAITPDAKYLLSADRDGLFMRWSLADADPASTGVRLESHATPISAMDLSDDGRWLLSGDEAGLLRLWDLSKPSPAAVDVPGHAGKVSSVDIDATGTRMVTGCDDGTAHLYWVTEGVVASRFATMEVTGTTEEGEPITGGAVLDVALSPDAKWILTGHADNAARLWDPKAKSISRSRKELLGHTGPVSHVAITPDGTVAITASKDDSLLLWELTATDPTLASIRWGKKGDETFEGITALGVTGPAIGVEGLEKASSLVATASKDGFARSWNVDLRVSVIEMVKFGGEDGPVTSLAIARDGFTLVTGTEEGTSWAWDWKAKTKETNGGSVAARAHLSSLVAVVVNRPGNRMMTGSTDGTAIVWDVAVERARARPIATLGDGKSKVRALVIHPDGKYAAVASEDGSLRVINVIDPDPTLFQPLPGHTGEIRALACSPDGHWLASVSTDRTARLWNMQSERPAKDPVVLQHDDEVVAAAISGDSRWLLTASIEAATLWDLKAKDLTVPYKVVRGHQDDIVAVALDPTGRWAATGSRDRKAILRDLSTPTAEPTKLHSHEEPVRALAFAGTGRWLATGDDGGLVYLWDLDREHRDEYAAKLEGHVQGVQALRWSDDGRLLLTAGNDGTIRIWTIGADGPEGEPVVLAGHGDVVKDIDLPSDASFVVSAGYDGSARVWPLLPEALADVGCQRLGGGLSKEQWGEQVKLPWVDTCPSQ